MNRTIRFLRAAVLGETTFERSPRRRRRAARRGPSRNWKYLAWIRSLPSAVSGIEGACEAAHTGSDGGMRQKASDYSCIPLTIEEHREYHQIGKAAFERRHGIDCQDIARDLAGTWFRYAAEVK